MGKRVFITGAGGFVGSVLTRRLLSAGHEIHTIVRSTTDLWRLDGVREHIQFHRVSLGNEEALALLMKTIRPEIFFHLAAHGAYSHQTDADAIIDTNILGTWNLLKASATVDYEVFVNTGSSSEYGFKDYAMREPDLLEPNSYYAVAKCAQTLLCQHFARAEKRPITTFRLFSVYGPYEEPTRLVPTLIRRCLKGEELTLVSPETARDFVFVGDAVDAYMALEKLGGLSGEIVNIGTGVQSTIRQVVEAVLNRTGAQVKCNWGEMPARIWDAKTWVADCTKSRRLLGWFPQTSLKDGLNQTIAWIREFDREPK